MRRAWLASGLGVLLAFGGCDVDPEANPPAAQNRPAWVDVPGARAPALPKQANGATPNFATSDLCAQCHTAGEGNVNRNAKGEAIGPVDLFRVSAMGVAARDPFYLAAFAGERQHRKNATGVVDATCTRCHAPGAAIELEREGKTPSLDLLTTAQGPTAELAREGVACTLCHQISANNLGTNASFTGGFGIAGDRKIFGPYADPRGQTMELTANFTPTFGAHVTDSKLCATCHTVITKALDASGRPLIEFPEQVTYLEWQNSDLSTETSNPGGKGAACVTCHMPASDEDGNAINTAVAKLPKDLAPRSRIGQHGFLGANAYLLRLIAANADWAGVLPDAAAFTLAAARNERFLQTAARVEATARRAGASVELAVRVQNLSGHRFPTGYPTRRAFLHVRVTDAAGKPLFESGAVDSYGRLVDAAVAGTTGTSTTGASAPPRVLDVPGHLEPHHQRIARADQVQVYESVPVDLQKRVAHRPLDAANYAKDTRLQPPGFKTSHRNYLYMTPKGTEGDADFGSEDTTVYVFDAAPGAQISVELLYQSVRPDDIVALAQDATPFSRSYFDMVSKTPPLPVRVSATTTIAP